MPPATSAFGQVGDISSKWIRKCCPLTAGNRRWLIPRACRNRGVTGVMFLPQPLQYIVHNYRASVHDRIHVHLDGRIALATMVLFLAGCLAVLADKHGRGEALR
jgi:hypothetical protein